MILYFTATGNSLDVARKIAETTGDELFDMGAAFKKGKREVPVKQGENLGIVFPTYRWTTPPLVDRFVRTMHLVTDDGERFVPGYVFTVETYGMLRGTESAYLARELEQAQGLKVDASFSVHSVEDCIYLFNGPDEKSMEQQLQTADTQAKAVLPQIANRKGGARVSANPLGACLAAFTGTRDKKRSVKAFNVLDDKCTGCGTCAAVCPTNTIMIVDKRPTWSGENCTECLACIQRCPQGASQYGKMTLGRRRYLNPEVFGAPKTEQ